MKQHHRMALGYCITILGGICWAIGGACGQTLFEQNRITSDWVVPIRLLLAGTLLVLFSALSGKHPMAVWKDKKNYPPLIAFGLIGSALCQYGYYTSIQYSNAAFATVLSYMAPVMILVYTVVKERRAPRGYELAAVLLVALGAFSCATQFKLGALHIAPLALIWGLLSAVAFAFYTITPQKLIQEYSLLPIVGWGMILGGIVLALLCRPWTVAVTVNAHLFLMLAGVIFLGTICSFCRCQHRRRSGRQHPVRSRTSHLGYDFHFAAPCPIHFLRLGRLRHDFDCHPLDRCRGTLERKTSGVSA